ncbi:MAG: response regulator [Myxococcales bacterium]|nr:response regulator [Myxococcales bacterium]
MRRILVVEDGNEYSDTLGRFLSHRFVFGRAGSGPEALRMMAEASWDAVFLDMCFDRVPDEQLLGDRHEVAERFGGDPVRARAFLQQHQGTFVLAALRGAGHAQPVLLSYDFSAEPRRFERLAARQGPLDHLPDPVPGEVERRLTALLG